MKKILCWIFGHDGFSYNRGTQTDPEEGWMCSYCEKDLEYGDEHWGLNLNYRVTKKISEFRKSFHKSIDFTEDMPF